MTVFRDIIAIGSITFNSGNPDPTSGCTFFIDNLMGWDDDAEIDPMAIQFAYADGAVPAKSWLYKEKYVDVTGWISAPSPEALDRGRSLLQSALDPSTEVSVIRHGPIPKQISARRSSKVTQGLSVRSTFDGDDIEMFQFTVMAPWPYKMALSDSSGMAGVYGSSEFFRTYPRVYDTDGNRFYITDLSSGGAFDATVLRVNTILNPSFEGSLLEWRPSTSSAVLLSDDSFPGWPIRWYWSMKVSATADDTYGTSLLPAYRTEAAEGDKWSAAVSVYAATGSNAFRLSVRFFDSAGVSISSVSEESSVLFATGTAEITVDGALAPAGTFSVGVEVSAVNPAESGDCFYLDDALLCRSVVAGSYFDGASPASSADDGDQILYQWSGAVHGSSSVESRLSPLITGAVSGQIPFLNIGNANAFPSFTVVGPTTEGEWYLENSVSGATMTFALSLGINEELVIDTLNRTATVNGAPVNYYLVGEWMTLPPGSNAVRLIVPELDSTATFRMTARSTWR